MSNDFEAISGVYALIDPRTHRVMYVGQSIDIEQRFRSHCTTHKDGRSWDRNRDKFLWIEELVKIGLYPELKILIKCSWPRSSEEEIRLIREYKASGQCELNIADGGNGCAITKHMKFSKDDWFQLGLKIKRVNVLVAEITQDVSVMATKSHSYQFGKVSSALTMAAAGLEYLLRQKFPEWEDVTSVFFGSTDP